MRAPKAAKLIPSANWAEEQRGEAQLWANQKSNSIGAHNLPSSPGLALVALDFRALNLRAWAVKRICRFGRRQLCTFCPPLCATLAEHENILTILKPGEREAQMASVCGRKCDWKAALVRSI